ncbi:PRC-barrel domain containing protein [Methylobacterium soli]|uniref:PRC-barrel domain containing protein n=2 Tax=Methylobacterium soli TaxID=553447 RepID=A0A6L3SWY8_9HYPH|nr:PRC-barrel domain-containing protein [Methylobacterium soli]KAB1078252.1 PRC-barrel domain containing protein [Methylobacterium soli]
MIATTTITLWAAAAAADNAPSAPAGSEAPPGAAAPAQPVAPPPAAAPQAVPTAPQAVPQQAAPQPAPGASPAPVQTQGTPATVLDTQDYESVLGKGVRSANGDELGRIIDVIIDKDGRPRAAIIDFGGFLGVGSRKIAVDWRSLRFTTDGKPGRLVLQLSRNQVRVSPEYKAGEPIVVLGPASPAAPDAPDQAAAPPAAAPAAAPIPAPTSAPSPAPATVDKPPEKAPDK